MSFSFMLNNNISKYPYEIICLALLSQCKYTQQFTSWNLLLSFVQPILQIPHQCMFINSLTTWLGFHYGATDGTKLRLMSKNKINSPVRFMMADIVFHYIPTLFWGYVVIRNKSQITNTHILRQMSYGAMYYLFVGKGFNCEKQYAKYPYYRQMFQALTAPLLTKTVTNQLISGNYYPLVAYLSYIWYGIEYLDINDSFSKL